MEASNSSLEADLLTSFLHRHLLVLVLVISVVKLWDDPQDPKGLPIELLFKVPFQDIHHAKLVAHHRDGKDVSERRRKILDSLRLILFEYSQLVVDSGLDTWDEFDTHAEQPDEVDQSTNGQDRNVLALICHVDHVSDDQLGHDLKNHLTGQLLGRAAFGDEAQGVL